MKTEIELTNPEVGYIWARTEGEYYLQNPNHDLRRISEDVLTLLEKLATGELSKTDINGDALRIVESLEDEEFLRSNAPVGRLVTPRDIALWPRAVLLIVFFGAGLYTAALETSELISMDRLIALDTMLLVTGISLVTVMVHESGHYIASRPYINPTVRLGTVNGVIPAAITDTTGAWLLPRNRRRWITLAGPFAGFLALLVVAGLHYTQFTNSIVLSVAIVTIFSYQVFSLNPLIHGDGYWLLVDTFELTDPRKRGLEHLKEHRPTPAAGYVVLSYGFAIVWILATLVMILSAV